MTLTRLSIDTLVATAPVLAGAPLEDRAFIRERQQPGLLPAEVTAGLTLGAGRGATCGYYYGCLDFLPFCAGGRDGLQLLEFNGTGMGGLTNLPWPIVEAILGELAGVPARLAEDAPVILAPLSVETRRGLIHERVLVAQALAEGLRRSRGAGRLWLFPGEAPDGPAVALGHTRPIARELLPCDGRLALAGRRVHAVMRDLYCQHLLDRHGDQLAPDPFLPINGVFAVCASKPRTYALYNEFLASDGPRALPLRPVVHWLAGSRDELLARVDAARARGLAVVIKPHAGGAGRGIEFFLPSDPPASLAARIDAAILDAERLVAGGFARKVFPYAVCELLDGKTLVAPGHPLHGHHYELRVVVYREGDRLYAFPAAAKLSGARLDPTAPTRAMLLNTASGGGHLLPLCNVDTLAALALTVDDLAALCDFSVRFVARVLA